ncbi:hypothetical protein [Bacillus sp. Marseille-P3661]|uniref:hypothetical protein n=1 Tax=Bacillus sp. Marseille-P3661 TaxID=1936234 RepID=UPI000C8278AC|nr:hypothetical protein [Bacillus sp. Marseille-P3661]
MKKLYIILSIILLLVVGAGGTAYYFLKIKTYDLSQDQELAQIAEEEYVVELPPVDSPIQEEHTSTDQESAEEKVEPSSEEPIDKDPQKDGTEDSEDSGESEEQKSDIKQSQPKKVTAASIKEKYRPSFENLESQANAKINSLVSRAISEFKEKKANGEKISVSYFLTKYNTAGESLEAKTDQAFEKVFAALQNELKANGFDPSEAEDVRAAYESAKKERRNALIAKAMENM